MTKRVLGFGELLLRLAPLERRLFVQAQTLAVVVGGAEANVIAGLSALGHNTAMLSCVADNPFGRLAVAGLGARGIDTNTIIHKPGRMGLYLLEAGQGLRASSVTYDRAGSAFAESCKDGFDFDASIKNAALLHLSGITAALGPSGAKATLSVLRTAKKHGVKVSFDVNYRALLWDAWECNPREILNEIIGYADILFGNHRDVSLLTGQTYGGDSAQDQRDAANAAFAAFPGLSLIACTDRNVIDADHHKISARVDTRHNHHQTNEISVTSIVDRIGTGDAFAAGVLHEWLAGNSPEKMAHSGLALCALKHSLPGDMPIFSQVDLDAFWDSGLDVRR
jgi:2-dehydro-3-deoxygluconokinase